MSKKIFLKKSKNIFLTGGTGFLGKAIVAHIAGLEHLSKIYVLIRSDGKFSPEERAAQLVNAIFAPNLRQNWGGKIIPVAGDLLEPDLGIEQNMRDTLINEVDQILHIGASTDFGAPIDLSREYNVVGTQKVLNLALECKTKGKLSRFDYVSTAYVAGMSRGVVDENTLERGQSFSNSYEQSKYEAEVLVRSYTNKLPTTIYRPSVVIGDSKSGYTPHFKVLYWPLRLLSKKIVPFCFLNKRTLLDVVPIDYVTRAIVAIMLDSRSIGRTFHLTNGLGREINAKQILNYAFRYANIPAKMVFPFWVQALIEKTFLRRFCPQNFWDLQKLVEPYQSYFRGVKVRFCNKETIEFLRQFNIAPPLWKDLGKQIMSFCAASHWGRKMPQEEYHYYSPLYFS